MNRANKTSHSNRNQKGFTLLELSFVIIIIGIMLLPMLDAVDRYFTQRKLSYTKIVVKSAMDMIVEYRSNGVEEPFNGNDYVYPCPAKRSLATTDNDFGESIDCTNLAAYGLNSPGDCADGICLALSDPPQDKDGNGNDDWVIIGGFPVTTIKEAASDPGQDLEFRTSDIFSTRMDLDGWHNQLTYAVSFNLTQPNTIEKFWYGVISAKDEFGNDTAGISNDAHFTILSHGPDGKGAYSNGGIVTNACGNTTQDDENCDNDAVFVQGLGHYQGNTASFYDDFAKFSKETSLSIWEETQDNTGRDQLFFAPSGNLGINDDATPPDTALTVNGEIKVNNNILVDEICDAPKLNPDGSANTNAHCFNTALIAGDLNNCGPGQALKGLWNNAKHCEDIIFEVPGTGKLENDSCSGNGNGWLRGFKSNGELICY
jgi:prepilin-type N-terminal cleavage/methylation domain-containing protein|tara:strand:- start:275643 stop:276929 length:1287 start_codon:yes stop_codon:yes gene_type:complete